MYGEQRAARIGMWALALGSAIGIAVFVLFYRYTDGWAENTSRPPVGAYYQQVTPDDLVKWPWIHKNKLVVMTGDVRRVIDGPDYIDPLVELFGRRLLGGVRVERQAVIASGDSAEAIIAVDFSTPPQLPGQITVHGRVLGPRALSNPLGDHPELPVVEAYEVCGADGACWSP
jgi:hypothetical protein